MIWKGLNIAIDTKQKHILKDWLDVAGMYQNQNQKKKYRSVVCFYLVGLHWIYKQIRERKQHNGIVWVIIRPGRLMLHVYVDVYLSMSRLTKKCQKKIKYEIWNMILTITTEKCPCQGCHTYLSMFINYEQCTVTIYRYKTNLHFVNKNAIKLELYIKQWKNNAIRKNKISWFILFKKNWKTIFNLYTMNKVIRKLS